MICVYFSKLLIVLQPESGNANGLLLTVILFFKSVKKSSKKHEGEIPRVFCYPNNL